MVKLYAYLDTGTWPSYAVMDEEARELPNTKGEPRCEEVKWRRSIKAHNKEITACLNPFELIPYFDSHNLLSSDDKEVLLNEVLTRKKKVLYILELLETTGMKDAYTTFFKCLREEVQRGEHMGHQFLLAILKGEQYGTVEEYKASEACKQRILEHRKDMHDIDLPSLVPVMFENNLISTNQRDKLLNTNRTCTERIEQLFLFLETKGPLAHEVFAQCLGKEQYHPTHAELHRKITGVHCGSVSRKRKKEADDVDTHCSIPKRIPEILRMEEPFCGKVYSKFITDVQVCYQKSSWIELESVVQEFILANEDPQLIAMATIEKGYSFSCRREMREEALECLGEAWHMARQIDGSNRYFLMARCKHIGATIYRYFGDEDKSLKENEEAFDLLFNCERADDASRVMYGKACARLEKLGKTPNPSPQEVMDVEDAFTLAIAYGRKGTPGMCASEARCLIRLAQLFLGTTTHTTHGDCKIKATPENVKRAENYLKQVDVNSISRRCTSLYYNIESDLFKNMGNVTKATESAEKALKIAEETQLGAEQRFAKSRLYSLKPQ